MVRTCDECNALKPIPRRPRFGAELAGHFSDVVVIDLFQRMYLIMIDEATRYKISTAFMAKDAISLGKAILHSWIRYFGSPKMLHSDSRYVRILGITGCFRRSCRKQDIHFRRSVWSKREPTRRERQQYIVASQSFQVEFGQYFRFIDLGITYTAQVRAPASGRVPREFSLPSRPPRDSLSLA